MNDPAPAREGARTDPRIAYGGPYLNVHPDVRFVGDAACERCHAGIAATFHAHPMGRSTLPIGEVASRQDYSERARNPFEALGSRFRVEPDGDRQWQVEERSRPDGRLLYRMRTEVRYAIGSGEKGYSYLTERDGYVFQSPLSWFEQKRIWDLSPGFDLKSHAGRPVGVACLFCHTNAVAPAGGATNRYEQPVFRGSTIGCERCHGPGSEHVRQRDAGEGPAAGPDHSIVNPRHLEPALREAVCQQCHLEGLVRVLRPGRDWFDFRPGLPLGAVWSVVVEDHGGSHRKAVNHVEQMYLSRCFQGSGGKLGCASCHNPHEKPAPARRVAHFRDACLRCHDCPTPLPDRLAGGRDNDCTACHMPRFSAEDIVHAASTDHRVVRTPAAGKTSDTRRNAGQKAWLFFPHRQPDLDSPDDVRDFALAVYKSYFTDDPPPAGYRARLLPLIEKAVAAFPDDPEVWLAKAVAFEITSRPAEALAACETMLRLSPGNERGLALAASLYAATGDRKRSDDTWRQVIEVNPWVTRYRLNLALQLAGQGKWQEAGEQVDACLDIDPALGEARRLRVEILLAGGRDAEAQEEFNKIEALNPPQLLEWRAWYGSRRRVK